MNTPHAATQPARAARGRPSHRGRRGPLAAGPPGQAGPAPRRRGAHRDPARPRRGCRRRRRRARSRPGAYRPRRPRPAPAVVRRRRRRPGRRDGGGRIVGGPGRTVVADAAATALPDACADVVIGEAMLSMQGDRGKDAVIAEAVRLLRPGGRYAVHELALGPDAVPDAVGTEVRKGLARAIRVNARPLPVAGWQELLEAHGLVVDQSPPHPWPCSSRAGSSRTRASSAPCASPATCSRSPTRGAGCSPCGAPSAPIAHTS